MDPTLLFWNELSHDKGAMRAYSALTPREREALSARADGIHTPSEMRVLVASIVNRISGNETF